ncbi:MoaD/ThiS family protein [Mycolicibacterium pulveris]|uniref:Molybdopterin synthase sulfur carrier subunit n=1 Tax=Mycolicibacterium pulveris TaxID=36813 RepID=A0A7I7UM24_MYCPV|nr:MoaD/ThiS family protein [Mycolicibacterium pulveris]MCV6980527.1 MoaD/ThiS family protein [Mycolicibacterium pulveris]BBY81923.1 molybdopterin synthase sulfur carrier subunit [Mycolicibacterium pulveris]
MTSTTTVQVTVRYFAAARAAAGNDAETIRIGPGTTVAELVDRLGTRDAKLAKVLLRCTFLCDGIAVRDTSTVLRDAQTVDVLPPFAGG